MSKILRASFLVIFLLSLPILVSADYLDQKVKFFIDSSYDAEDRREVVATLREMSFRAYFYVEDDWWNSLSYEERNETKTSLFALGQEFDQKIYPTLTSNFGSEWSPGIDNDNRVTVLIHQMREEAGGYFNYGDE
jgi:hypothetical protein